jgi:beta-lactamase regulating signal transducer with metallopeptidase domain
MSLWLHVFDWLAPAVVHAAWQGAVLAAVVWLLLWALGTTIAARWRFLLWSMVLVRLVVPVVPSSPTSLFRLLDWRTAPVPIAAEPRAATAPVAEPLPSPAGAGRSPVRPMKAAEPVAAANKFATQQADLPQGAAARATTPRGNSWSIWQVAGLIWISGVMVLASKLFLEIRLLGRRKRSWRPVADPQILANLADCRRKLAIRSAVELRVSPAEASPAVTGIWRARIVVPESLLTKLSSDQLALVFLHELAHVRRRDVMVQWLLIGVRLLHWFNPAVWLVVSRMQAERELACDELVLDAVGSSQRSTYGETLMAIVSETAAPALMPGLLGAISTTGRLHRRMTMIRDYRKRSWRATLAAVAVLAVVAALGLTDVPRQSQAQQKEAVKETRPEQVSDTKAAEPKPADEVQKKTATTVRKLLDQVKATEGRHMREASGVISSAIRDLVTIGPDAVPALIEELDTTQNERMMRTLGFTLRAIGDKRAVPALIRTIPKTCQPPSSDYGCRVDDAGLMAFMRKHDWDWGDEDRSPDNFSFGRPVVEISGALQKLTGQSNGEMEIMTVFLNGSDHQQRQQRRLYQRSAQRWAEWWEANWKQQVADEAYAHVSLYVRKDLETGREFPHGPNVKFAEPSEGMILQSIHAPEAEEVTPFGKIVFMDLDTGRIGGLPKHLRSPDGAPEKMDEISAWAAREGFDVMGTEYIPPGEKQPHYVIRSLGLTAWQIKTDLWNTIEDELKKPEAPSLGTPADGLLAQFDEAKGQYDPKEFVAFLFVTREGGYGALFVGAEVTDTSLKPGTPALPPRETERSSVGFYKGRRLSFRLVEDPTK